MYDAPPIENAGAEGGVRTVRRIWRAAIIGCGRIADSIEDEVADAPGWALLPFSHAGAYQRCPRTELVAAADPNAERRARFGERRGVERLYADYREMLDRETAEWVSGELEPGRTFDPGARGVIAFPESVRVYVNCSEDDPTGFEVDITGTEGRIRAGNALYPEWWQVDRSGRRPVWVRRTFPGTH